MRRLSMQEATAKRNEEARERRRQRSHLPFLWLRLHFVVDRLYLALEHLFSVASLSSLRRESVLEKELATNTELVFYFKP